MIEKIFIENEASYKNKQELSSLKKINFIYGSNGTGKTTISRIIANDSSFPHCRLTWSNGNPLKCLVYNHDFVEKNFNQPTELKGIFTLGENDTETIKEIATKKKLLESKKDEEVRLKNTLDGESGKKAELQKLEGGFKNTCWELKKKYDEFFKVAFTGVRNSADSFKQKILDQEKNNTAELKIIEELKNKANTIFEKEPKSVTTISPIICEDLLGLEQASILQKNIIGKEDVDIATMIKNLGNSDWVKQGRVFYQKNNLTCPFCQQKTESSFSDSLNSYFDVIFEKDIQEINHLLITYGEKSQKLQRDLELIIESPSDFLNTEKLKIEKELLDSKISNNLQRIKEKQDNPSHILKLESLKSVLIEIKNIIDLANNNIKKHNQIVLNFENEKSVLISEVWRFLLEELKDSYTEYNKNKNGLEKSIVNLNKQIEEKIAEYNKIEPELRKLEKNAISIEPTIKEINKLLTSFGFDSFTLEKSDTERYYRIHRADGTNAKNTLSEGEKTFITFLYFYHLLKGNDSESNVIDDRIVVFDDPISSLDSNILFIVSSLIKELFNDVRINGNIKQVFILTHNVYFHKEITFNKKRNRDSALNDETFWMIKKSEYGSIIKNYECNFIKSSYQLLWLEVKNKDTRTNLSLPNTLRRIIESYFKILGGIDTDKICNEFEGRDKLICNSLFSWMNAGSHGIYEDLFVSIEENDIDNYLKVFEKIFDKMEHSKHYEMMMGE